MCCTWAFPRDQKHDTYVYIHTYTSEPAIRDDLPHAKALGNYVTFSSSLPPSLFLSLPLPPSPSLSLPLPPLFIVQPVLVVDLGFTKEVHGMSMEAGGVAFCQVHASVVTYWIGIHTCTSDISQCGQQYVTCYTCTCICT